MNYNIHDAKKELFIKAVKEHPNHSPDQLCELLGITKSTFYRFVDLYIDKPKKGYAHQKSRLFKEENPPKSDQPDAKDNYLTIEIESAIKKIVDERFFRNTEIVSNSLQTDLLPLKLTAVKFHISESFLYKLHYQQRLKFYKLGALTYVRSSELESLFEEVKQ